MILFDEIEKIEQIVDLFLEKLRQRLSERRIGLELTEEARQWIARQGYDPVYGTRPLRRLLQQKVETGLGRRLLAGEIAEGATVRVELHKGDLAFETGPGPAAEAEATTAA